MSLTKSDLQAIDQLLEKRIGPLEKGQESIKKDLKKINKKFDKLFNFLDREWSKLAKRISYHDDLHGIDTKNLQ